MNNRAGVSQVQRRRRVPRALESLIPPLVHLNSSSKWTTWLCSVETDQRKPARSKCSCSLIRSTCVRRRFQLFQPQRQSSVTVCNQKTTCDATCLQIQGVLKNSLKYDVTTILTKQRLIIVTSITVTETVSFCCH